MKKADDGQLGKPQFPGDVFTEPFPVGCHWLSLLSPGVFNEHQWSNSSHFPVAQRAVSEVPCWILQMGQPGQQHEGPQETSYCSRTHKKYFISPSWVCIVFLCSQCGGRELGLTARFGQIRQQLPKQWPLKQCWCLEQRSKLGVFFLRSCWKTRIQLIKYVPLKISPVGSFSNYTQAIQTVDIPETSGVCVHCSVLGLNLFAL